jgi:hypothetical protein
MSLVQLKEEAKVQNLHASILLYKRKRQVIDLLSIPKYDLEYVRNLLLDQYSSSSIVADDRREPDVLPAITHEIVMFLVDVRFGELKQIAEFVNWFSESKRLSTDFWQFTYQMLFAFVVDTLRCTSLTVHDLRGYLTSIYDAQTYIFSLAYAAAIDYKNLTGVDRSFEFSFDVYVNKTKVLDIPDAMMSMSENRRQLLLLLYRKSTKVDGKINPSTYYSCYSATHKYDLYHSKVPVIFRGSWASLIDAEDMLSVEIEHSELSLRKTFYGYEDTSDKFEENTVGLPILGTTLRVKTEQFAHFVNMYPQWKQDWIMMKVVEQHILSSTGNRICRHLLDIIRSFVLRPNVV